MKKRLSPALFFVFFIPVTIGAQTDFEKKTILSAQQIIKQASDLQLGDMDNDGDLDYIVSAWKDCTVRWLENGGNGEIVAGHMVIDINIDEEFTYAKAADIDGDGDMDIIGRLDGYNGESVFLLENMDGAGNFSEFRYIANYSSNIQSSDIYAHDVDQDGDNDLIIDAGQGNSDFTWLENINGDGSVWQEHHFADQAQQFGFNSLFKLGDVNNDGFMDIVTSYTDKDLQSGAILSQGIRTYLGDGQGSYTPTGNDFEEEDWVRNLELDDMDQDGDLDVVYYYSITNSSSINYIKLATNNGQGVYGSSQVLAQGIESFEKMATIDLENDGDQDIVYTSTPDNIIFKIESSGAGNFQGPQVFDSPGSRPKFIAVSDFDQNGSDDIVVTDSRVGTNGVLKSDLLFYKNDNGSFDPMQRLINEVTEIEDVTWADLNNDGFLDIIGATEGDNRIFWFEGLDTEGNTAPLEVLNNSVTSPSDVITADLDGDNDLDLVISSYENNTVGVLFNTDGQGTMGSFQLLDNNVHPYRKPLIMDLDQDNDLDIVVADSGNSGLIVYFENQDGEGTFSDRQILTNALIRPDKMVAYDFDNDGDQDILYHGNYNSRFYLLQNFGGAVFSDPILLIDGQIIEYLINWEMADLDGDGINDFIGSMSGWGIEEDLFWIKHIDGNGTFEQFRRPIYQLGDFWEVIDLRVIDLDLDGDLDIVLQAQFYLMWYENLDGQGIFGGAQEISWANNYSGLDITDVDGDERPDLLISAYISGEISWFRNVNFLDNPTIIEPELAFYPNPTHGPLTFVSEIPVDNIILLNGQGATIGSWEDINTLDLSQLRSGLYFARITLSNGSVITKKILKY